MVLIPAFLLLFSLPGSAQDEFKFKLTEAENEDLQKTCGQVKVQLYQNFVGWGFQAQRGQFPWIGTLFEVNVDPKSKDICAMPSDEINIKIGYGGVCQYPSEDGCSIEDIKSGFVSSFYIPEEYFTGRCVYNDWAIIELEDEIEFDDFTQPICLMQVEDDQKTAKQVKFQVRSRFDETIQSTGFGKTETYAYTQDRLLYINGELHWPTLPFVANSPDLIDFHAKLKYDRYPRLCDGDSGSGTFGKDSYDNDRFTLIGINAWSDGAENNCDGIDKINSTYFVTSVAIHADVICQKTGVCLIPWPGTSKKEIKSVPSSHPTEFSSAIIAMSLFLRVFV